MLRYFALATLIVFGAIALVLALPRSPSDTSHATRYVSGNGRKGPGEPLPDATSAAFTGVAPWALSTVPECFRQIASYSGPVAFARAHIPRSARRVPDGFVLHVADCTLRVSGNSAILARETDRFDIPAPARFYTAGSQLVLDGRDGNREAVRLYDLRTGNGVEQGR